MPTSRPSPFARFYDLESKLSPSWGAHRCIQRLTTSAKRSPASRKGRENFPTLEPAVGRISGAKGLVPSAYTHGLCEHVDGSEATGHLQIDVSCFKTLCRPCFSAADSPVVLDVASLVVLLSFFSDGCQLYLGLKNSFVYIASAPDPTRRPCMCLWTDWV